MMLKPLNWIRVACLLFAGAGVCSLMPEAARAQQPGGVAAAKEAFVYVGTYTRGTGSKGIYIFRMQLDSGDMTPVGACEGCENPTFLAVHPNQRWLYAIEEIEKFGGKPGGGVCAYSVDPVAGGLTLINKESAVGAGPCHVTVDKQGRNVLLANYGGGSVAVLPIAENGRLAPHSCFIQHTGSSANPSRQESPHAHSVNLDAAGRFAFVADLGLDKVMIYRFNSEKGTLEPNVPAAAILPPGSGPRHFAFHPSGKFAYVINELASTVTAFAYDAQHGALRELQQASTLPADFHGDSTTADVQVHPSGRFLYGSNRGHDSIAIYAVDHETGKLTPQGHESTRGKTPRNFAMDPTGNFLLAENQGTNNIVVFRIDRETGKLSPTGKVVEVPSPVCIKMIPVGAAVR